MQVVLRVDLRHWMVGVTFDRYNTLISIGPLSLVFANHKKYQREMEKYMMENGGQQ